MNQAVLKWYCPDCDLKFSEEQASEETGCPRCGRRLRAVPEFQAGPHSAVENIDDEALVAELREAFGFGVQGLTTAGANRGGGPGSGTVFDRSRGAELRPGSRLGDFEILEELGRGGMGIVYRARQVSLGREVALKVLPARAGREKTSVQRFHVEAQAAARLHHTNIVPIYAQGEHEGLFYYAMELVEGISLDTVIHTCPGRLSTSRLGGGSSSGWSLSDTRKRGRPGTSSEAVANDFRTDGTAQTVVQEAETKTPPETPAVEEHAWSAADYRHLAGLMAEVADALDCAHRHGVIHRDVKPHNLLLGPDQRLHLTDFGLARLTDEPHLTVTGEIMGTPAYLSPEQVRGTADRIDHRTDIYSLGVTLYELLTRRKPYEGLTREQIINGICHLEPVPPRKINPRIPLDLETICLRAIEKDPARRHPTAALLAEDLRRFAAGLPILSRRTTRLEKAVKWVRRHPATTAALGAGLAAVVLATALTLSMLSARWHEAQRLAADAYEQLAYRDYRRPELVLADLDRAAALGDDSNEYHLARALAHLGATDEAGALPHIDHVVNTDPEDPRGWYLLAWTRWRMGDRAAAREAFEAGERCGAANRPDAWFFRGLAVHFDDPAEAMVSYRRANRLRSEQSGFYPQAVLHLARARNQQLYSSRVLEPFPEAVASLEQLVENGYYGSYPYYLLSIAHRLAAEIYSGSEGTRDDSQVTEHYAQALDWARRGQTLDPTSDRCFTAEAECLESMGRWEEAIEARTLALEVADKERARCEAYHYRWRLYYWTGRLNEALADVRKHAACMPENRCYAHVYPALILAEAGDMPAALAHARALADEAPEDAQAVIWAATTLRLLGEAEEAAALLEARGEQIDFSVGLVPPQTEAWVRALYDYCRRGGSLAPLEALAGEVEQPWKLWGEAYFHAAARWLAEGRRAEAIQGFRRAYRAFDGELRYTYHAKLILEKLQQNDDWPAWLGLSWNSTGCRSALGAAPCTSSSALKLGERG